MRKKVAEQVRADALAMARRKLDEGCPTCAEQYARVAAVHGASRRDFLKAGLGTVAGVVALTAGLTPLEAAAAIGPCDTCEGGGESWCEGCTLVIVWWCIDTAYGLECESSVVEVACSSACC